MCVTSTVRTRHRSSPFTRRRLTTTLRSRPRIKHISEVTLLRLSGLRRRISKNFLQSNQGLEVDHSWLGLNILRTRTPVTVFDVSCLLSRLRYLGESESQIRIGWWLVVTFNSSGGLEKFGHKGVDKLSLLS